MRRCVVALALFAAVRADAAPWFADADGDGFGTYFVAVSTEAPAGTAAMMGDCDDSEAEVHPGAEEICDGVDNDCDGPVDEGFDATAWFEDLDGDGFGGRLVAFGCEAPADASSVQGDCDDEDAGVYPDAPDEIVGDGVDSDCDGGDPHAYDPGDSPEEAYDCHLESWRGDSYAYCLEKLSWADAEAACGELEMHLVTLGDAAEDAWVCDTSNSYEVASWWTGFNDLDTEAAWVWVDGTPTYYTNWGRSQPSNDRDGEHCMHNNYNYTSTWNDIDCSFVYSFVCES